MSRSALNADSFPTATVSGTCHCKLQTEESDVSDGQRNSIGLLLPRWSDRETLDRDNHSTSVGWKRERAAEHQSNKVAPGVVQSEATSHVFSSSWLIHKRSFTRSSGSSRETRRAHRKPLKDQLDYRRTASAQNKTEFLKSWHLGGKWFFGETRLGRILMF